MLDFELQRCTRQCAKTNRELQPGEPIYSVLVRDGAQTRRVDFATDAWSEPPAEAIAWWKSNMPGGAAKRNSWAPQDVILSYFERLADDPSKADVRFVLTLFMLRRRILRLDRTEQAEDGREVLIVYSAKHEAEFRVETASPTAARAAEIQTELAQLLMTPGG